MIPIKLAIHRVRGMIHDFQRVNYSDHEILDVLNFGLRLIRRTIADIQPEILMSKETEILQAGDKIISCVEGYSNKKNFSQSRKNLRK